MPRISNKICRTPALRGAGNSHLIPSPEDYHKCNSAQQIRLLHWAPNRIRPHRVVILVPAQIIRGAPVRRLA